MEISASLSWTGIILLRMVALSMRQHRVTERDDQLHLNSENTSHAKKYCSYKNKWLGKNIMLIGNHNGNKDSPRFVSRWFALALACQLECVSIMKEISNMRYAPLLAYRWTRATISWMEGTVSAARGSTIYLWKIIASVSLSPAAENHTTWYSEWGRSCPQWCLVHCTSR